MQKYLNSFSRHRKQGILIVFDYYVLWFSLWLSYLIRFGSPSKFEPFAREAILFISAPIFVILSLWFFGAYHAITRYSKNNLLKQIFKSILIGTLLLVVFAFLMSHRDFILPRSTLVLFIALSTFFLSTGRNIGVEWISSNSISEFGQKLLGIKKRRLNSGAAILIYGAGAAGRQIAEALSKGYELSPVGFIDDNPNLWDSYIEGLKVYSPNNINSAVHKFNCSRILFAIPSASRHRKREIIESLAAYSLHVLTMPGLEDLASGRKHMEEISDVKIEDVLGRDPIPPIKNLLEAPIKGKSVMVTGAGGSIGSELCRQILQSNPAKLILFEHSEFALYQIHNEIEEMSCYLASHCQVIPVIGSVQDADRVNRIVKKFELDTIFHAAAYKHVPMVEYNLQTGFENNVLGSLYLAQAAIDNCVSHFVLISTDKAVRPTNFMGATKRLAELVVQSLANTAQNTQAANTTHFTSVRFGNVLDSSGSVIPLFKEQIKMGGPITITDSSIERFFMTIPEAAQLVIQAGAMGNSGEVYLLEMGNAIKIVDMARKLIKLHGLTEQTDENPDGDIKLEYTGLRPGEKLYEELLVGEDSCPTEHPKIFNATESSMDWTELSKLLQAIEDAITINDLSKVRTLMVNTAAIGYHPSDPICDWLH